MFGCDVVGCGVWGVGSGVWGMVAGGIWSAVVACGSDTLHSY